MSPFHSIVSLGIEVDSVAFGQFWDVLLLFSGIMLSIKLYFLSCKGQLHTVFSILSCSNKGTLKLRIVSYYSLKCIFSGARR